MDIGVMVLFIGVAVALGLTATVLSAAAPECDQFQIPTTTTRSTTSSTVTTTAYPAESFGAMRNTLTTASLALFGQGYTYDIAECSVPAGANPAQYRGVAFRRLSGEFSDIRNTIGSDLAAGAAGDQHYCAGMTYQGPPNQWRGRIQYHVDKVDTTTVTVQGPGPYHQLCVDLHAQQRDSLVFMAVVLIVIVVAGLLGLFARFGA